MHFSYMKFVVLLEKEKVKVKKEMFVYKEYQKNCSPDGGQREWILS